MVPLTIDNLGIALETVAGVHILLLAHVLLPELGVVGHALLMTAVGGDCVVLDCDRGHGVYLAEEFTLALVVIGVLNEQMNVQRLEWFPKEIEPMKPKRVVGLQYGCTSQEAAKGRLKRKIPSTETYLTSAGWAQRRERRGKAGKEACWLWADLI